LAASPNAHVETMTGLFTSCGGDGRSAPVQADRGKRLERALHCKNERRVGMSGRVFRDGKEEIPGEQDAR